jgi:hypothetical protein
LTYFQSNIFESLRQICIVRYSESVMENFWIYADYAF